LHTYCSAVYVFIDPRYLRVECRFQVTLLRKFYRKINGKLVLVLHIFPEVYNLFTESKSIES